MNRIVAPAEGQPIEAPAPAAKTFTVLSPVGTPPKITKKTAAPRLESLDGKTIYLVDCRFDDSIELLKQVAGVVRRRTCRASRRKIVSLSATYQTRRSENLGRDQGERRCRHHRRRPLQQLRARRHHARDHARDQIRRADRRAAHRQVRQGRGSVAKMAGLPEAPRSFVPQPVMGKTAAELAAYVNGNDPITGRPVMQEVVAGADDGAGRRSCRPLRRRLPGADRPGHRRQPAAAVPRQQLDRQIADRAADATSASRRCSRQRATSPTRSSATCSRSNSARLGIYRRAGRGERGDGRREAGIFSGDPCARRVRGLGARQSSSSSSAMMVVVNGPIRHEIGMNCGIGAMGPYNHANATIGRAYGLLSQNLQGGSVPGETFMGSLGNNYGYNNITFAENEERSPWEPLHVQKGFKPTDSHREHFLRLPLDDVLPRPAREILARARARHARGHRRSIAAVPAARSDHRAAIHRPRRLRHQGKAHPLHPRNRRDAGRALLGSAAGAELRLSVGDVRPGADGDVAQSRRPTNRSAFSRRTRSTWSSSAAKPTAIGASWAPNIANPSPSTPGGKAASIIPGDAWPGAPRRAARQECARSLPACRRRGSGRRRN